MLGCFRLLGHNWAEAGRRHPVLRIPNPFDTSTMAPTNPPSALLFLAPTCIHCPLVLDVLTRALKEGRLGRLEAINLVSNPLEAERYGVRTVPWLRIGPFELVGALAPSELRQWIDRAAEGSGWAEYYAYLIEHRQVERLVRLVGQRPNTLADVVQMVADPATPLATRIGISVVLEELAGDPALARLTPQLEQLTLAESATIRADACHFLGLAGNPMAIPAVKRLLDDPDPDVREIAAETLALLRVASGGTPRLKP